MQPCLVLTLVLCLWPATTGPAASKPAMVAARYDCVFQPWVGGRLIDGKIVAPERAQFRQAPVHTSFIALDPARGSAVMQIGQRAGRNTPARLTVHDAVIRFSFAFPGQGAGAVTLSRREQAGRYPAVKSGQDWLDGHLSVGYSIGSCRTPDAG